MKHLAFSIDAVASVPPQAGVYLFRDAAGKVLYVGKARRLQDRVRTYFGAQDERPVTKLIAGRARQIEFILTDGEKQALLLENSLIKQHDPPLNVKLRDDSLYFSLQLNPAESWPRLRLVRRRKGPPGSLFFGPYTSVHGARRLMRELNSVFPLRSCDDAALHNRARPCLEHEIGRCLAPCTRACTEQAYQSVVTELIALLRGQSGTVLEGLQQRMQDAAEALEYERAADLRDRLKILRGVLTQPQLSRRGDSDEDVIAWSRSGARVAVCVLQVRSGVLAGSTSYELPHREDASGLLEAVLLQHYSAERTPPALVLVPELPESTEGCAEILSGLRGSSVQLVTPQRGARRSMISLAERNAAARLATADEDLAARDAILTAVQERFRLRHAPARIEGFDISHQAGSHVTGSCVAFLNGKPDKAHYRSYRLREVQRNDDFAAMEEVLRRRVERGLRDGDLPDLLLIDGGTPQLERVVKVLRAAGAGSVDVLALAKGREHRSREQAHERVWMPDAAAPLIPAADDPALLLLMRVRDEAHRRALRHSRQLKRSGTVRSVLEFIPGVGAAKRRALLQAFGSVGALRRLDAATLATVPGISASLAQRIHDQLQIMAP